MATVFKKNFFSGDLVRGAENGTVTLIGRLNLGTYATGGPEVDFTDIHADCVNANIIYFAEAPSVDMANYALWDSANNKIVAYVRSTDAEVANGVDLNTAVSEEFRCFIVFSIGTPASTSVTLVA
jgi:hypothetical protein